MLKKLTDGSRVRPMVLERNAALEFCVFNCQGGCTTVRIDSANLEGKLRGI